MTTETNIPTNSRTPTGITVSPESPAEPRPAVPVVRTIGAGATGPGAPAVMRGRTSIAATVVEKIAGMAAREIPGVSAPAGGGLARMGSLRHRLTGNREGAFVGVKAEVGERQTAIDLNLVIEYGLSIPEVTAAVRENVILGLERMTGLEVVEVNIVVEDVFLPEEEVLEPEPAVRVV
ncbi:Asp23/Gls24 family envelope stress response protein [Streptomyces sp. ST2-7A]|uniref:Asp23/Gls24 family envelope stress response protein n=1 Tax=Streptomyces sp. ST2-7A TaxID=2907214 RepID=UPI001F1C2E70|nr:Asp23/Gls24 family envelope stress response protein [Streptomyces sp. ST2-7A]MCE7082933.1 Asp23/Gls24 family envelope stress response protein [Streptomyces sp. ST2-7A]